MNEKSVQKCRTCLMISKKMFPLNEHARGCRPKRTYGQLLKEYANLEFTSDYEHLMPQHLCALCCRELRSTNAFVRQAKNSYNELINLISKQFLQEKTIDLPPNENELEKSLDIKIEKYVDEYNEIERKGQDSTTNGLNIVITSTMLKSEVLEESTDNDKPIKKDEDIEEMDIIDNDQNYSNDLPPEFSTAFDNTIASHLDDTAEEPSESQIDTACPICGKIMSRRDNLLKHMRSQHDIEEPCTYLDKHKPESKEVFTCKICADKYINKHTFLYHIQKKHGVDERNVKQKPTDKIIKCRSCDYTARNYSSLNYHNRSKHGSEKDKFKCKFCANLYLQKFDLLTHVKNSHKELIKTLKAEAVNKADEGDASKDTATTNTNLTTSSKYVTTQDSDNCLNETEYSRSNNSIPLAQKITKSHTKPSIKTEVDNEQFSDEEFIRDILNIKKRKTKSSSSLARRCDECGNIYKNYKTLHAHQRQVHISEDKYSLCPHCGKKYKRKTDLRIHIEKTHIPKNTTETAKQPAKVREKRFMCTECSYVCHTITILNVHRNRHHTGEKPYKCDICFKSFIVPYDLKIHRYLHTGERPYKCPICSKGFRDNSHMIKHKRIHSSERPYKCKDCGKGFTQSYNLSVHRRTHLKEKKLNCAICGKVFENRSLLNIHRINENHHDEVV